LGDDINFNAAAMSGHGKIKYYQNHKTRELFLIQEEQE
jgi:hypothetical protein